MGGGLSFIIKKRNQQHHNNSDDSTLRGPSSAIDEPSVVSEVLPQVIDNLWRPRNLFFSQEGLIDYSELHCRTLRGLLDEHIGRQYLIEVAATKDQKDIIDIWHHINRFRHGGPEVQRWGTHRYTSAP